MPEPFQTSRLVEFHDTDMAGIMHFASFFIYMESAEHELYRSLGLSIHSIVEDEHIAGSFTNGLTRTIGQIALAKFSNPDGLVDAGNNVFRVGPNSGTALSTNPGEFGTGRVVGGALELSNVDLSQEFINMILASTGYSAASRVITTTNELIDQLLVLGR